MGPPCTAVGPATQPLCRPPVTAFPGPPADTPAGIATPDRRGPSRSALPGSRARPAIRRRPEPGHRPVRHQTGRRVLDGVETDVRIERRRWGDEGQGGERLPGAETARD